MDRLNPGVSSGAVPSGNNHQAVTASAAGDAPPRQSPAPNLATISVDSGLGLDDAERDRVVQSTSKNLLAHYFNHEKAAQASGALRTREKDREYRAIADGTTLAQRLTADIRSETQDPHVEVLYSRSIIQDGPRSPSPAAQEQYRRAMTQQNCTFEKVEILPHRVGYLKFNSFPDPDICGVVAHASLEQMRKADVIIIDLRDNTGGYPEMVAKMAAPLFDRPVPWYNPRAHPGASTLFPEPGSGLAAKPVYILTSSLTYSGAEHFTYDLKMLKRAIVVGETTGGAAHSGVFHRIDDHFGIGIPETRIANPYGGPDWSVIGVEPDVKVSAADALTKAEQMATKLRNK
jgi:hypothetical protein